MTVFDLVKKIAALEKITPTEVSILLGKPLSPPRPGSLAYTASDIELKDATIEFLDFRGPKLLVLSLKPGCIPRSRTFADFGPLTISGVPSGHRVDEQTYFSKPEAWGTLAFGFPENFSDCLKTVVFNIK